jgi:hypothetical protein
VGVKMKKIIIETPLIKITPTLTLILALKAYLLNLGVIIFLLNKEGTNFNISFLNYIDAVVYLLPLMLIGLVIEGVVGLFLSIYNKYKKNG